MTTFEPASLKVPGATAALVLGIVSVAGVVVLVPVVLGPIAWYLGASARREAERDPRRWSGSGAATAGMALGIVATGLLLGALLLLALVVAGQAFLTGYDSGYGT